jgi:IS30 family transposase
MDLADHSHRKEHRPYQQLHQELKHGKAQKAWNYHETGVIPDRVSIEKQPALVEKRKRIGDVKWIGGDEPSTRLTGHHRQSFVKNVTNKNTDQSFGTDCEGHHSKMKPCENWIKTMTYDNDMAFTRHQKINEVLGTKSFFTHPYTSQDKGTVENRIGVIRRFFPKKTDFTKVTHQQVKQVEKMINERPVRKFKYQTPNTVFLQKLKVALID